MSRLPLKGKSLLILRASSVNSSAICPPASSMWALVVVIRHRQSELAVFHCFSVVVWAIWLVPYFTGMIGAMI